MKKISIMFLPEHLQKTLSSVKIDLSDLDLLSTEIEMCRQYYDKNYYDKMTVRNYVFDSCEDIKRFFKNKISLQDISDFIVFNKFLTKKLFRSYRSDNYVVDQLIDSGVVGYGDVLENQKAYVELLNMYFDKDVIINENNLNQVFSIVRKDNCIFVILKNGFGNMFTLNREDLQNLMMSLIFDQMIKTYGEQALYNSGLLVKHLETL